MMESTPAARGEGLRIERLSVAYRGVTAVENISLDVELGTCVAIVGANGAGKTSTLHAIGGLIRAKRGCGMWIGAEELSKRQDPAARARLGLGHVLEDRHVFTDMTVEENLDLAYRHRAGRASGDWGRPLAARLFPELQEMMDRKAGGLSGGQQQFVAIARALAAQPSVLMLDEPTNGLAPQLVDRVVDVLQAVKARGITVLLVEQRLDVALEVADRIEVMSHGRVVGRATAGDGNIESMVEEAYLS